MKPEGENNTSEPAALRSGQSIRLLDWTILTFLLSFPTLMAIICFVLIPRDNGNSSRQVFILIGKLVQFGFPVVLLKWRVRELRWKKTKRNWGIQVGITFGLIVAILFVGAYYLLLSHLPILQGITEKLYGFFEESHLASPIGFLTLALFTAVVHSFLEEFYWRWFTLGALRRVSSPAIAIGLSTLFFTSYHIYLLNFYIQGAFFSVVLPLAICVGIGGGFWGWLYHKTSSLMAVWLSHLLVDLALIFVEYQMLSPYWQ